MCSYSVFLHACPACIHCCCDTLCTVRLCVFTCVFVCVSHSAPLAIYSFWDLVSCAHFKCQHCQSEPPISPSPCCWALPVFISADRWTPHPQLPPPWHTTPSIHPSTHLLLPSPPPLHLLEISLPLPVGMFGLEFIMCGSSPAHLTAVPVLPVSSAKHLCTKQLHTEKKI